MKRIRLLRKLALGLGLLSGVGVRAQVGAGLHARVYAVKYQQQAADFVVPQVQLADAGVARRLNYRLGRLVLSDSETDSTATLPQQLRQAARACCYDAETKEPTSGQGVVGLSYEVMFNAHGLLSIAYTLEINGAYSWAQTRHATFDLRTGQQLSLATLVSDPPAQLTARMRGAISRRFGETMAAAAETEDAATLADLAERLHWNRAARHVKFATETSSEEGATPPELTDFALTPAALLVFYGPVLPHIMLNLEPDDTYRFPYARLHPGPLLRPLLPAAPPAKAAPTAATKK
ncbi:MAG: hypothetical protein ACRYFX_12240 [Janthinobacterium lividum]